MHRLALFLIVLGLACCRQSSEDPARSLRAWISTGRLVGHAWCAHELPIATLHESLAEVRDQLTRSIDEADRLGRGELSRRARDAAGAIDRIDRADASSCTALASL